MTKVKQDFEIWNGTDNLLRFIITASDGSAQILTGSSIRWILQDEYNSSCWLYSACTGGMISISGSQVDVVIEASRISTLNNGLYYHELKLLTTGSIAVLGIGYGRVNKSSG